MGTEILIAYEARILPIGRRGKMVHKLIAFSLLVISILTIPAIAEPVSPQVKATQILDPVEATKLEGEHLFSLQWISWDDFGAVTITRHEKSPWTVSGRQDSRENDDYLVIDGIITEIDSFQFTFEGMITTKVSFINNGNPTRRSGRMTFKNTGKRQYWRLAEMQNPNEDVLDYIDIFFNKPKR